MEKKTKHGNRWGKALGKMELAHLDSLIVSGYPGKYIAEKAQVSIAMVSKRTKVLKARDSFEHFKTESINSRTKREIIRGLQAGKSYLSLAMKFGFRPGTVYKMIPAALKKSKKKTRSEAQEEKIMEYQKYLAGYRDVDPNWWMDFFMIKNVINTEDVKRVLTDTVDVLRRGAKELNGYIDIVEEGLFSCMDGEPKRPEDIYEIFMRINYLGDKRQTKREKDIKENELNAVKFQDSLDEGRVV